MNKMPGFTAEASLGLTIGRYRYASSFDDMAGSREIVPMQVGPWGWGPGGPVWWPPGTEFWPPLEGEPSNPIGGWPTEPPPLGPPPPPSPPPIPPGGGFWPVGLGGWLIVGGALIAIGLSAWRLYRWWHTPPPDLGPSGPICRGTGRELALRETWDWSGWGCEQSLQNAIKTAQAECNKLASRECIGQCSNPTKSCSPVMAINTWDDHPRGAYCWTDLTFTCPCQCI
jgi:hypothetical protein